MFVFRGGLAQQNIQSILIFFRYATSITVRVKNGAVHVKILYEGKSMLT